MHRTPILLICLWQMTVTAANAIDYNHCHSIEDIIDRETQEIACTHFGDHDELSRLYVSRGESYLCDAQYEKAKDDFDAASYHIGYAQNIQDAKVVTFRAIFGKVVSCDNLGLNDHAEQAIQQLQELANCMGCDACLEDTLLENSEITFQNEVLPCKHTKNKQESHLPEENNSDHYYEIQGPNLVPPSWCEEVVTGVARAMDAIACLAPNYGVKIVLIGIIEALLTRGLKCCQTGDFWKACVAPISRKWLQWDTNKKNKIFPTDQNLHLYNN